VFYIESNGFAATTFLAQALCAIDGMHCYHGTRAIPAGLPLGSSEDLTPELFVGKMLALEHEQQIVVGATHAKFDIVIAQYLTTHSAPFALAVRAPVARICSCHGWVRGKFERGENVPIPEHAVSLAYRSGGLDASFDDLLFAFSMLHVVKFDVWAFQNLGTFSKVFRMEEYTQDQAYFSSMVSFLTVGRCSPTADELKAIFSHEQVNSHTGQGNGPDQQKYSLLTNRQQEMLVTVFRNNPSFKDVYQAFGYDVEWMY
jgi:hypothetical protein